jgi:hypothetical protein
MDVKFETSGFLKDAAYSFHFYNIGKEYEEKFTALEILKLEIKEVLADWAEKSKTEIKFSDNLKECQITTSFFQYTDRKGKITGKPSPAEVFHSLKFILEKAVKQYRELRGEKEKT